jgi:hypothetical protein
VISLRESGKTIKQMVLAFTSTQTEQVTPGFGKTISSMERAKNSGLMGVSILGTTKWGRKMARVNTGGQTVALIMDLGLTTKSMAAALIFGLMEDDTLESGRTTICMAMESTGGKMDEDMRVSI